MVPQAILPHRLHVTVARSRVPFGETYWGAANNFFAVPNISSVPSRSMAYELPRVVQLVRSEMSSLFVPMSIFESRIKPHLPSNSTNRTCRPPLTSSHTSSPVFVVADFSSGLALSNSRKVPCVSSTRFHMPLIARFSCPHLR